MNEPNQALIFIYRRWCLCPASFQQEFGEKVHTIFMVGYGLCWLFDSLPAEQFC